MPGSAPGAAEELALFVLETRLNQRPACDAAAAGWAPETDLPATQERKAAYRGLVAARERADAPGWGKGTRGARGQTVTPPRTHTREINPD